MGLDVFFFNRDFTARVAQPRARWRVERLTWAAIGGARGGVLRANGLAADALPETWADLLRCPVEIVQHGVPVWWGYVNSVALRRGGRWLSVSLEDAATCVRVDWQPSADSPAVSVFARDEPQIARFGERQVFLRQGTSGDNLSALASARGRLAQLSPPGRNWRSVGGARDAGAGDVRVELRGWWHTLGWRFRYPQGEASSGWSAGADEDHPVGSAASSTRCAQPFSSPAQPLVWSPYTLRVNLRKVGSPTDRLRISIQADVGGAPGGVELDVLEVSPLLLSTTLTWFDLRFENLAANIAPGQVYYIVFQRTGALSSGNYYRVGLDLMPTPIPGVAYYLTYNGSVWSQRSPGATALYSMQGASDSLRLAEYYAGQARGGQFLSGVQREAGLMGRSLPVNKPAIASYRREISDLLMLGDANGGRVLAQVGPQRGLRIFRAADAWQAGRPLPLLDESGALRAPDGAELSLWQAGSWAVARGLGELPVFLEALTWDGARLLAA